MISLPDGVKCQPDQLLVPDGITTTITMSTGLCQPILQMLSDVTVAGQMLDFILNKSKSVHTAHTLLQPDKDLIATLYLLKCIQHNHQVMFLISRTTLTGKRLT